MAKSTSLSSKLVAEFIGTLFFVLIAAGSVVAVQYVRMPAFFALFFVALTTGVALALAISITMGISGGSMNPAVTIGLLTAKKLSAAEAALYIVAEVLGATVGAAFLFIFFPHAIGAAVAWGTPALSSPVSSLQAIAIEAVLTFFLVMAVFGTAVDERAPKIGGFGIGLTVFVDAMVGGSLTGAAMNPARWMGPAIVSMSFANWYVYWVGPVIGGIIAALVYTTFLMQK